MKTVLFYRDFRRFQGGHLKVWDYFNHVMHTYSYRPKIYFSEGTVWDDTNPWLKLKDQSLQFWEPSSANILFLAGKDWLMLNKSQRKNPPVPVINYIQHVRHSDSNEVLYSFLEHKAIRICVSDEVASAIIRTGRANGPVLAIPNGLNFQDLIPSFTDSRKEYDVLIAALKQPELGRKLGEYLMKMNRKNFFQRLRSISYTGNRKLKIEVLTTNLLRKEYLDKIRRARITVFLPNNVEGCYLPPLEGMALGTLVICPDSIGSYYCQHGINCLRPSYTIEGIINAVNSALQFSQEEINHMLSNTKDGVSKHDLLKERSAFLEILENINHFWG